MATYIPQDNDGVLIGDISAGTQTNDIKVTLDSEEVAINDGGNVITIDGTVTANLSATDNAVLDQIELNQDSQTALLTTIDGDTSAIATDAAAIEVLLTTIESNQLPDGHNVTVDNASIAVTGTVTANLSATDNTVLDNIDSNTDSLAVTGGGTETGALRVTIANNSTGVVSVDDNGGALTVDGTVAATQSGTWNIGTLTGITNDVSIDDGGNSITIDGSVSAAGNVAHDAADSGNPIKIGMKTVAHGSNPTAVAASDRTDWYANRHGVPFIIGGHPNIVTYAFETSSSQANASIVSVGAGSKIVVTEIDAINSNASTASPNVYIGFGASTTPTTTGVVLTHPGIAPGSGVVRGNGSGILGIGGDGEDLRITCAVPTAGVIRVIVSYFTIES